MILLSLGLWQHFLSLLRRGDLLLGVAQRVAGTRGDSIGHCPARLQPCELRCFFWGCERTQPWHCLKRVVGFQAVRADIDLLPSRRMEPTNG